MRDTCDSCRYFDWNTQSCKNEYNFEVEKQNKTPSDLRQRGESKALAEFRYLIEEGQVAGVLEENLSNVSQIYNSLYAILTDLGMSRKKSKTVLSELDYLLERKRLNDIESISNDLLGIFKYQDDADNENSDKYNVVIQDPKEFSCINYR